VKNLRVGITKFPGTNNELDVARALRSLGVKYDFIFPEDINLFQEIDAVVIAGGFSYGDYLRPGAIASQTPIIEKLQDFNNEGRFIIGICNGFQILCELKILPGVLTTNSSTRFISKWVYIKTEGTKSPLLERMEDQVLRIPIAHFDGRYFVQSDKIEELKSSKLIAFRYSTKEGEITEQSNPNGSIENIAGILNSEGNVLGLMPHPERASFDYLGSDDGKVIFENLVRELKC
jgi:phosphoribosylformylglycinamidine synthase